jgi:hypothetical protein
MRRASGLFFIWMALWRNSLLVGSVRSSDPATTFIDIFRSIGQFNYLRLRICHWCCPLEAVWSQQRYHEVRRLGAKSVFGACWTTGARNDALWQIYAKAAPAVRIRTSVGALIRALSITDVLSGGKVHVGKVRYCSDKELIGLGKSLSREAQSKDVSGMLIRGLMHKRSAFAFEDEFRVLWVKKGRDPRRFVGIPIDCRSLIDQVRIDPRLDGGLAVSLSAFRTLSGVSDVKQSSLAKPPAFVSSPGVTKS